MKTEITVEQLGAMDDEQFIAHVQQYPLGSQWESAKAFQYAATRLARMKGLQADRGWTEVHAPIINGQ